MRLRAHPFTCYTCARGTDAGATELAFPVALLFHSTCRVLAQTLLWRMQTDTPRRQIPELVAAFDCAPA